jgi:UPF0271 protein
MGVIQKIDINCDLGEGMPNDESLMPYISSCNIACGGHFGTKDTIRATIRIAKEFGVKVGAHPSYPDRENFGRKSMDISTDKLIKSLSEQISLFLTVCNEEGVQANHIKLHGALYNDSSNNEELVDAIQTVYKNLNLSLPLYLSPHSILAKRMRNAVIEAFIDRRYNEDGSLTPRTHTGALIEDPIQAWEQLSRMYLNREVTCADGKTISINATTFCIHGDTKNALEIARFIDSKLKSLNIILDRNG